MRVSKPVGLATRARADVAGRHPADGPRSADGFSDGPRLSTALTGEGVRLPATVKVFESLRAGLVKPDADPAQLFELLGSHFRSFQLANDLRADNNVAAGISRFVTKSPVPDDVRAFVSERLGVGADAVKNATDVLPPKDAREATERSLASNYSIKWFGHSLLAGERGSDFVISERELRAFASEANVAADFQAETFRLLYSPESYTFARLLEGVQPLLERRSFRPIEWDALDASEKAGILHTVTFDQHLGVSTALFGLFVHGGIEDFAAYLEAKVDRRVNRDPWVEAAKTLQSMDASDQIFVTEVIAQQPPNFGMFALRAALISKKPSDLDQLNELFKERSYWNDKAGALRSIIDWSTHEGPAEQRLVRTFITTNLQSKTVTRNEVLTAFGFNRSDGFRSLILQEEIDHSAREVLAGDRDQLERLRFHLGRDPLTSASDSTESLLQRLFAEDLRQFVAPANHSSGLRTARQPAPNRDLYNTDEGLSAAAERNPRLADALATLKGKLEASTISVAEVEQRANAVVDVVVGEVGPGQTREDVGVLIADVVSWYSSREP